MTNKNIQISSTLDRFKKAKSESSLVRLTEVYRIKSAAHSDEYYTQTYFGKNNEVEGKYNFKRIVKIGLTGLDDKVSYEINLQKGNTQIIIEYKVRVNPTVLSVKVNKKDNKLIDWQYDNREFDNPKAQLIHTKAHEMANEAAESILRSMEYGLNRIVNEEQERLSELDNIF